MDKSILIKQARNMILRSLDKAYTSGLTPKVLYMVMCTVNEAYDFDLLRKDVAYLTEKGYICLSGPSKKITLKDVKEDSLISIKITAEGLEVIQDLKDDPALEI